ncbi:MAG: hypothetical protein HKL98_10395 [Burkholderiales bacterium]|nr:hypothetical protein [Burkholderiales bacterium]
MKPESFAMPDFETAMLLATGGDERIALKEGRNLYGCSPWPERDLVEFGSSTASTISEGAYRKVCSLRKRIGHDRVGAAFFELRSQFADLFGMAERSVLFCESGTDAHRIACEMLKPDLVLMVEAGETGKGVPLALSGAKVLQVPIRDPDGRPRDPGLIDADFARLAREGAKDGKRVLLVQTDVSKTGMIAPSYSLTTSLKTGRIAEILVDACQFRISGKTLLACRQRGFMVALTGSKFFTGPTFSGALVFPDEPFDAPVLEENFGLLLRWEAALFEMKAFLFREQGHEDFFAGFAKGIAERLEADPAFFPVPVPAIDRSALAAEKSWDSIASVFPFMLRKKGRFLGREEALAVHSGMRRQRFVLGQPVYPGTGAALRISSSARLALLGGADEILHLAMQALDKAAWLASDLG